MRLHNALRNRNLYGWGLAALLVCSVQVAHAGYTSVVPPSPIQGGPGAYTAQRTAELAIVKARNSANAYAKGVGSIPGMPGSKIPFMARVSVGGAAAAARAAFLNPYLVAAYLLTELASNCVEYTGSEWQLTCGPEVNSDNHPISDGYYYYSQAVQGQGFLTYSLACDATLNYHREVYPSPYSFALGTCTPNTVVIKFYHSSNFIFNQAYYITQGTESTCPAGWYVTPAGCVQNPPPVTVDEESFVEKVAPLVAPEKIPDWAPGMPIPVETPQVLPDNDSDEDSATPRPLYIPDGEPQAIPNTDPQQYTQRMTRVVPAPTTTDPWRVDLQPVERTTTSPDGVSEPTQNPNQTSSGTTAQADQFDLCKEHPDILACQKLEFDTPADQIPRDQVNISYTPESFLGGGGSCPSPTDIHFFGRSVRVFETSTACGWVSTYMRPILLALCAWLSISIVLGGLGGMRE